MFHLYLSISCVSSWSFPAGLSVLLFQLPLVMLSLPRIFDDAPVAYLTPPSRWTVEGVVLVDTGGDWPGMVWLLVVIAWWVLGKVQPDGAHPSQGRGRGRWIHHGTLPPIWPLVFVFWRYPPSDAVLTPAISSITERLVEGGSVFLPVQVQRTCPPPKWKSEIHQLFVPWWFCYKYWLYLWVCRCCKLFIYLIDLIFTFCSVLSQYCK